MARYELRDPIHSRIPFSEFERAIIDHRYVQRLRFISQLGFLQSLVYPGALHDRFTHSLGTMHVAGRLFARAVSDSSVLKAKLSQDEVEALRIRVRVAGLLHDIGHGPFSHASELLFPKLKELPMDWSWWQGQIEDRQAIHEDYSVLLINQMAKEGAIKSDFAQDVCSLIHADVQPSEWFLELIERLPSLQRALKGLISGEVDADRMDYLLRDSYYCGVAYGTFDIDWLISSIGVGEKEDGSLVFTISENGVRAFEDLLLARYHMIDQVYFHKTKAGFTHYLEQAIKQEIDLTIPTDPEEYAFLRDGAVIEKLFKAAKDESNYFAHHLMSRIAAKRILRFRDLDLEDMKKLDQLKRICDQKGVKWFTHSVANELSHLGETPREDALIYVRKKTLDGYKLIPVFEYSDLLQKYNEKLRFTDFFVRREDYEKFSQSEKPLA